jgi:hypothetical protein
MRLDSGLPRKESPLRAVFRRFRRKPGGISYGWLIVATMTLMATKPGMMGKANQPGASFLWIFIKVS